MFQNRRHGTSVRGRARDISAPDPKKSTGQSGRGTSQFAIASKTKDIIDRWCTIKFDTQYDILKKVVANFWMH